MKTLSQRAYERRKALGLSQEAVGKACGVSQEAIRQMESGNLRKPPHYLDELAQVLQTTREWLKSGIGPKEDIMKMDNPALGETGYKGKRAKLSELLALWDSATDEERVQFLAIALIEYEKEHEQ